MSSAQGSTSTSMSSSRRSRSARRPSAFWAAVSTLDESSSTMRAMAKLFPARTNATSHSMDSVPSDRSVKGAAA